MLRKLKTINVEPDSELGHLLDEATDAPVVLEKNGGGFLHANKRGIIPPSRSLTCFREGAMHRLQIVALYGDARRPQ